MDEILNEWVKLIVSKTLIIIIKIIIIIKYIQQIKIISNNIQKIIIHYRYSINVIKSINQLSINPKKEFQEIL